MTFTNTTTNNRPRTLLLIEPNTIYSNFSVVALAIRVVIPMTRLREVTTMCCVSSCLPRWSNVCSMNSISASDVDSMALKNKTSTRRRVYFKGVSKKSSSALSRSFDLIMSSALSSTVRLKASGATEYRTSVVGVLRQVEYEAKIVYSNVSFLTRCLRVHLLGERWAVTGLTRLES